MATKKMPILPIDETVREVLAQANADQNQHWPPRIISSQYNLVTDALLDEAVKAMGENNSIKVLLRPFYEVVQIPVKYGKFELPEDFRNFAGLGIYVKNGKLVCESGEDQPEPTDEQMKEMIAKAQVECTDIDLLEIDEWNNRSRHSYKKPTLDKPIACMFETNEVKVAPYDIQAVELRYIRKPKKYNYGVVMNTNDTFSYDPTMKGAVESEWGTNARAYLFKGMNRMYSVYARDGNLKAASSELSQMGFF